MSDLNYTIAHQWAEARQLLNDAGYSGLTLPAAVAVLLPPPADEIDEDELEAELAAAVARHPAGRNRRPSLTVVPVPPLFPEVTP